MLIKSMTGYGRAVETVNGREFTVELRSVNNRYLDCTVKLPRSVSFAEEAVKQAVKASISRGKVDVYISVRSENGTDAKVTLNVGMVEGYLVAMEQMAASYPVKNDISVSLLSRMPEVFTVEKPEVDEQQLLSDLMSVVEKALAGYDAMRAQEGKALENDLRNRGASIEALVGQVEAGNAQTVIDYRARLEAKLKEVLASTTIDESRILTEAAIFADKVAVDEETVRLRSHLQQMYAMLTGGGAVGRKLDFLLQEMNREANTIGSKCTDVRLARVVVDIKAELEKIREQTQNIEEEETRDETHQHRLRQHGVGGPCADHCGTGFGTDQACGPGSAGARYAHRRILWPQDQGSYCDGYRPCDPVGHYAGNHFRTLAGQAEHNL